MLSLHFWFKTFGVDVKRMLGAIRSFPTYIRDGKRFRSQMDGTFAWAKELPILDEKSETSGELGAYFYQDILVARWIMDARPVRHVDIGSRIDGFIGHLSLFREVDVLDIRPQPCLLKNIRFHQIDLMAETPQQWKECTDSLSCLHTIEHFGLGRYGDTINANGHNRGIRQIQGMVAKGGMLYLSTPIGPQRIEFNAHRIFAVETLIGWFNDGWTIEKMAVIDDEGKVRENVEISDIEVKNHFGCHHGLGIIAARKI